MKHPKTYVFHVVRPSEYDAGIIGYTEEVHVTLQSGDPGWDVGEFEEHVKFSLEEWFDGAKVTAGPPPDDSPDVAFDPYPEWKVVAWIIVGVTMLLACIEKIPELWRYWAG